MNQLCPGDKRYEITSPVFDKIVIKLDPRYAKGKTFTIIAKDNSVQHAYIKNASLNGKAYQSCHLNYEDLVSGGTLELQMTNQPEISWGTD
jgi:putative alpha-1,2-mannosidase